MTRPASPAGSAKRIGDWLRGLRIAHGMSQERLAELAGRGGPAVTRAVISSVERGRHLPGPELATALARALHVDLGELVGRIAGEPGNGCGNALSPDDLESRAAELLRSGDARAALAVDDALLRELTPVNREHGPELRGRVARIEIRRAEALERCGAADAARAAAERVIELSPDSATLSAGYAAASAALQRMGQLQLAGDMSERAVACHDRPGATRGRALLRLGSVLLARGQPDGALERLLEAREQLKDDPAALALAEGSIGLCRRRQGRPREARGHLRLAVEIAGARGDAGAEARWSAELARSGRAGMGEEA